MLHRPKHACVTRNLEGTESQVRERTHDTQAPSSLQVDFYMLKLVAQVLIKVFIFATAWSNLNLLTAGV